MRSSSVMFSSLSLNSSVMSASFFEKVMKLLIDYFQLTVRRPAQLTRSYLAQILLPLPNPFKPLTIRKPKSSTNRFTNMPPPFLMSDQPREPSLMRGVSATAMHNMEQSLARNFLQDLPWDERDKQLPSYKRRQRGSMIPYLHHYNASRML